MKTPKSTKSKDASGVITPAAQPPAGVASTRRPQHIVHRWLTINSKLVGKHPIHVMSERPGVRTEVIDEIRAVLRSHYVSSDIMKKRVAALGAPKTARLLREHAPKTKRARSGDLGEVLATEISEHILAFRVPIRRLRWKDGREMALRGDDIIGIRVVTDGKLEFLKGESKSRAALSSRVLDEAGESLDRDRGRPTRHSVLFVAERLRELGDDALAQQLENAVLDSFSGSRVEHLLLAFTGGDPTDLLNNHLRAVAAKRRVRHAVGVRVVDHGTFIDLLFGGL